MAGKKQSIRVGRLRENELEEANRIVRLAFGTFLRLPDPLQFMGDRSFVTPRWRSRNTAMLAAREGGKLIGLNVATRWGAFGFLGPLTVLPDYWNRGVAQQLLAATTKIFDRWGVRRSGLFTFAESPKHVGLYQKFGYWPGTLTAIMKCVPAAPSWTPAKGAKVPMLLSSLTRSEQRRAIKSCAKLANKVERGLDLSDEIRAVQAQHTGEVILIEGRRALGAGSEGGEKVCYVKFGAASDSERFDRLLDAIDALALARAAEVEAGVSTSCVDAYQRMRTRGYRSVTLGVAMQRPGGEGFNRASAYVLGDWR